MHTELIPVTLVRQKVWSVCVWGGGSILFNLFPCAISVSFLYFASASILQMAAVEQMRWTGCLSLRFMCGRACVQYATGLNQIKVYKEFYFVTNLSSLTREHWDSRIGQGVAQCQDNVNNYDIALWHRLCGT